MHTPLVFKENDLVELFGLNTTKYLRERVLSVCQWKIRQGSPRDMHSCLLQNVRDELLNLNEVKFHGSQIKIEEAKSTRQQTIVSSPAKISQKLWIKIQKSKVHYKTSPYFQVNEIIVKLHNHIHLLSIRWYLRIASRRVFVCPSLIHC